MVGEANNNDSGARPRGGSLVDAVRELCSSRFGLEADLEWGRLDGPGLRTAAQELAKATASLQHHQHRVLALIDERRAYAAAGSRDAADWAADNLGMSRRAANDGIGLARSLEDFPALAAKAESGELSTEQAAPALTLATTAATNGDTTSDTTWATHAPNMGVGALRRRAARAHRPPSADHAAARAARVFNSWRSGQELRFNGSVPIDAGATLLKAIERAMPDHDPDKPATLGRRQADGLLALASVQVSADADPDRATVVALVELAAICDDDPAATAELEGQQPLATDTARRLVCDSRLSVLVQDATGRAVGLGTTARTVTPALRRALMVRDGRCRFGDCSATRFLHAHHIEHWPAPTTMANLAMVCLHHHHALHEGGWTLTGDPFATLVATHPDGRRSPSNEPRCHEHHPPPSADDEARTPALGQAPPAPALDPAPPHRPVSPADRCPADTELLFPDTG